MPFEFKFHVVFEDFNQSKFLVATSLLLFSILLALQLDHVFNGSFWFIFLPLWIWKIIVFTGAVSGIAVWIRRPHYRAEPDSFVQFKAMVICTSLNLILFAFEVMACYKLESQHKQFLWVIVFTPLLFLSIASIGVCVWAVRNERNFELETFFIIHILQFVFLPLRLDGFIHWDWVIVLIPEWIAMSFGLMVLIYNIILAIILSRSRELAQTTNRRNSVFTAFCYAFFILPLLVFLIGFVNKMDNVVSYHWSIVFIPLYISLISLAFLSIGAKAANQWWFGLRRDFCPLLLTACPVLQEYGNISYKTPSPRGSQSHRGENDGQTTRPLKCSNTDNNKQSFHPIVTLEVPD